MTGFWPGLVVFLVALASGSTSDLLLRLPTELGRVVAITAVAASVCCLVLGVVHALSDWGFVDLLGVAGAEGVSVAGKRGIGLLLVEVWPFVMIVMGLVGTLLYGRAFQQLLARQ